MREEEKPANKCSRNDRDGESLSGTITVAADKAEGVNVCQGWWLEL